MPCAVVLASLAVAGCSVAEGSGLPPMAPPTPTTVVPKTQKSLKPAADCAKSTVPLPTEAETDGVQLTLSTDSSGTSLLIKNTGNLSVVVIPDANFSTSLEAAPYANPQDHASRAALIAVNNSGAKLTGIPKYVPLNQVVNLPPRWALCALTDDVKQTASVRYLYDRSSTAEYFVTKALADQLIVRNGSSSDQARPALIRCAKATLSVLKKYPKLSDIQVYVEILGPRYPCRAGYKALLNGDAVATEQLEAAVIGQLGGAPRLLANSQLFTLTARP
ncbi:hypothetical protein [Kribbella soli]|uniref:Uncharacterized protein n=1 Tax=Kribbella soli TaxID=1124743 RepID=A0A4R0HF82_9ACTN|nr:hypothetical protein [Kribbella soli]TCC08294.1 hypothetical protein E0H45_20580 [Kribbella soli]